MVWINIARIILRNRLLILITIALITGILAILSQNVRLQYGLPKMLPDNDSTVVDYQQFRERFGEESIVIVAGIEKDPYSDLTLFNSWFKLNQSLKQIFGVDTIVSATSIYNLSKNNELKKFELKPLVKNYLNSQTELDSLKNVVHNLPFYEGVIFNTKTDVSILAISLNKQVFNSPKRDALIHLIVQKIDEFGVKNNLEVHYSGLPYIRTVITQMVKKELKMFIVLALLVTVIFLFLFFRNHKPVLISLLVVGLSVVWSLGTMAIFDYEITILTSIIPPLIIVIGIPNCIFLINKYHNEYRNHGNKAKSLTRMIQKIGKATLLTNATTATGFLTFIFTSSTVLIEFGIIASISILYIFILSIVVLPIVFSYLKPPNEKHTNHLNYQAVNRFIDGIVKIVLSHRTKVYIITSIGVVVAFFGISKIRSTGNLVDDLPKNHKVTRDLKFFEKNFAGIMPFDLSIDAKNPREIIKSSTLLRIDKLQEMLFSYPQLSKPISVVDGIKFSRQAFYNGNPEKYDLVKSNERAFFKPYIDNASKEGDKEFLQTFMDTSFRFARVNVQIADIGTLEMEKLVNELQPKIDSILPPDKFEVNITGQSIVYLAGTKYLVTNLFQSLALAIVIIGIIMALLFSSFRMILISIVTNLIPLIFTAGMMGYFNIPIKPSTILVFSIAFGISVDDTIHYLAKFRQELKLYDMNMRKSVLLALQETGVSMFYTSVILFFGFSVFGSSEFGGTQALGILVSFTLLVAMFSNLVLLPSLLLTLEKRILTKAFQEPMMNLYDEEEDIELDDLEIDKGNHQIQ